LFEHDENESTEEVSEESGKKDAATSPSVTIDGSDTSCPLITQRFLYIQVNFQFIEATVISAHIAFWHQ